MNQCGERETERKKEAALRSAGTSVIVLTRSYRGRLNRADLGPVMSADGADATHGGRRPPNAGKKGKKKKGMYSGTYLMPECVTRSLMLARAPLTRGSRKAAVRR